MRLWSSPDRRFEGTAAGSRMPLRLLPETDGERLSGRCVFAAGENLEISGDTKVYNGLETDGVGNSDGDGISYHFCMTCGSTVYWIPEGQNAIIRIAVGNFLDPDLPAPTMEFYVKLRHRWVLCGRTVRNLSDSLSSRATRLLRRRNPTGRACATSLARPRVNPTELRGRYESPHAVAYGSAVQAAEGL